jgi:murein DD-endopeptidase MepM/ murein hydrolase activator NlpD
VPLAARKRPPATNGRLVLGLLATASWSSLAIALALTTAALHAQTRRTADLAETLDRERAAAAVSQRRLSTAAADAEVRSNALEDELQTIEDEADQLYATVRAMQGLGEQLRQRVGLSGPAIAPIPDPPPRIARVETAQPVPSDDASAQASDRGPDPGDREVLILAVAGRPFARPQFVALPADTGPWPLVRTGRSDSRGESHPNVPSTRFAFVSDVVQRQWDAWQQLDQAIDGVLARRSSAARPGIHPASGPITSGFGWRSGFWGALAHHTGIDISLPIGTAVAATADGTVVFAGTRPDFGQAVEIQHADGLLTLYGHLSRPLVRAGQTVLQGQVVALSGNSGITTGPHLHYEVRLNGAPVDPRRYW